MPIEKPAVAGAQRTPAAIAIDVPSRVILNTLIHGTALEIDSMLVALHKVSNQARLQAGSPLQSLEQFAASSRMMFTFAEIFEVIGYKLPSDRARAPQSDDLAPVEGRTKAQS